MASRMAGTGDLSERFGRIYDSALDAGMWPAVLECLSDMVGGGAALLIHPTEPFLESSLVSVRDSATRAEAVGMAVRHGFHLSLTDTSLPAIPESSGIAEKSAA